MTLFVSRLAYAVPHSTFTKTNANGTSGTLVDPTVGFEGGGEGACQFS